MAEKIYDMAVVTGTYQKDGQEKKRYANIGAVFKGSDGGFYAVMDKHFNPAGIEGRDGRIMISFFPPKQRDGQASSQQQKSAPQNTATGGDYLNDDIPF